MNLNSVVEKRMNESAQQELTLKTLNDLSLRSKVILEKLSLLQTNLNECRTLLNQFGSGSAEQQKQLTRLENSLSETKKNISLSTSSSQKANENQTATTQAILKAVKPVTVGRSFKLLMLVNTILNAGIILLVLYLIHNL